MSRLVFAGICIYLDSTVNLKWQIHFSWQCMLKPPFRFKYNFLIGYTLNWLFQKTHALHHICQTQGRLLEPNMPGLVMLPPPKVLQLKHDGAPFCHLQLSSSAPTVNCKHISLLCLQGTGLLSVSSRSNRSLAAGTALQNMRARMISLQGSVAYTGRHNRAKYVGSRESPTQELTRAGQGGGD